jgi:hypothetical protein
MVAIGTKKGKSAKEKISAMLHTPMTATQKEKLEQMAAADRRPCTHFVRILIEDEWDRRQEKTSRAPAEDFVKMYPLQCSECGVHCSSPRENETLCGTCRSRREAAAGNGAAA